MVIVIVTLLISELSLINTGRLSAHIIEMYGHRRSLCLLPPSYIKELAKHKKQNVKKRV